MYANLFMERSLCHHPGVSITMAVIVEQAAGAFQTTRKRRLVNRIHLMRHHDQV